MQKEANLVKTLKKFFAASHKEFNVNRQRLVKDLL
jgi:hypothetical protein